MKQNVESGSVVFHHVGSVKFWLTSTNRIFVTQGSRVAFPHLQGSGVVKFDDPTFTVGQKVEEDLRRMLRKQREVRMALPPPEEDAVAFEYH